MTKITFVELIKYIEYLIAECEGKYPYRALILCELLRDITLRFEQGIEKKAVK